MSCTFPSLEKCEEVRVISELFASRIVLPSGNLIWPRPLASVLTESPGWTTVPEAAAAYAPPALATDTVGRKAVRTAPTLVAAEAARLRPNPSPPTIRTMITSAMISRRPPRPLLLIGAAAADIDEPKP